MITGILVAVGIYVALGAGFYVVHNLVESSPFDTRQFVISVLSWPTELFGGRRFK